MATTKIIAEEPVPEYTPGLGSSLCCRGYSKDGEVFNSIAVSAIKVKAFLRTGGIKLRGEGASWCWVGVVVCSVALVCSTGRGGDIARSGNDAVVKDGAFGTAFDTEFCVCLSGGCDVRACAGYFRCVGGGDRATATEGSCVGGGGDRGGLAVSRGWCGVRDSGSGCCCLRCVSQQLRSADVGKCQLTPTGTVLVEVVVVVTETVLVAVEVLVFVAPSKQEHALLIFEVNGLPLPHPAPRTEGTFIVGTALFLRSGSAPRET